MFPTQGLNLHFLRCMQILSHWATWQAQSLQVSVEKSDICCSQSTFLGPHGSLKRRRCFLFVDFYAVLEGLESFRCLCALLLVVQSLKLCPTLCDSMDFSTRLPCFSLSLPVCSNSCPLSRWCQPITSSSAAPCGKVTCNLWGHSWPYPLNAMFSKIQSFSY